jgi:hypothetical protein
MDISSCGFGASPDTETVMDEETAIAVALAEKVSYGRIWVTPVSGGVL